MIKEIILQLASLITATTVIVTFLKKFLNKLLDKQFKPLHTKIDDIDKNQCRNYLVDFLADVENGVYKDECQIQRAYDLYDHYTKDLKGNSYIHDKWEKLMAKR